MKGENFSTKLVRVALSAGIDPVAMWDLSLKEFAARVDAAKAKKAWKDQ